MKHVSYAPLLAALTLLVSLVGAKFYSPPQYNHYKAGPIQHHHHPGKPTSRHKNHCAYVVEKTVSFTMQEGAAPYVKAEYNKCPWGKKCPALLYRLVYKPIFKVAHKTVTELEWRCCPGFSGYGCMESVYHHPVRMMPPFTGPSFKGPQFKGPPFKGPQHKGPTYKGPMLRAPMFKGPPVKANPWSQTKGPPSGGVHPYAMRHFEPPMGGPSYPETSFEQYPSGPQPMPDHHDPHQTGHEPEAGPMDLEHGHGQGHGQEHGQGHGQEHGQGHGQEHGQEHGQDHGQGHEPGYENLHGHAQEQHVSEATAPTHEGREIEGRGLNSEADERLDQMEDDIRRLTLGLETLRGTVNGLEGSLRSSLREDANRMLSALLSAGPGPVSAPSLASSHSAIGFGDIPGGGEDPVLDGVDGRRVFPPTGGDLHGRIEELRADLRAKTAELLELRTTVMTHDGALKTLSSGGPSGGSPGARVGVVDRKAAEILADAKLSSARAEILGGFEERVAAAEGRCEERAGEVRRQCQREHGERQQQMQQALEDSASSLKTEMVRLKTQLHGLESSETCCGTTPGLVERMKLLEISVAGLNRSQGHLQVALDGHKDHIEGMLEGRLGYVETKLNLTGQAIPGETAWRGSGPIRTDVEQRLEAKMEALEGRLLIAVEELGNATAPALLEGHAVPTLETELESLRRRLEVDVDRVQKHLSSLEVRCTSSCSSSPTPSPIQGDVAVATTTTTAAADADREESVSRLLDLQAERLDSLNATVDGLLKQLALMGEEEEEEEEGGFSLQGELTVLKFNMRSVNRTLSVLQGSVGTVARQVDRSNRTWHEREERLAQQMRGMVQLVGHQASMLGSGERRLTRLKGELQDMKRRLAGELQGCRSTALGVRQEVSQVEGRMASVEDQCKGLNHVAEDLERIREELERQSDGLFTRLNGTLVSHARQLSDLRGEIRNCTSKVETTQQTAEPPHTRGDTFTLF